jgi:hypothetical protein
MTHEAIRPTSTERKLATVAEVPTDVQLGSTATEHESGERAPVSKQRDAGVLRKLKASDWLALLAIAMSLYATRLTWRTAEDSASSQSIKGAYDTFYDINRMELANTDVSHMFALPESYGFVASRVAALNPHATAQVRAQMELKERAVALAIFTIFERNLYELNQARTAHDSIRADFLGEVVKYFTGRLLRNPRLSYYWELRPGGIATYFENTTRAYFETNAPLSSRPVDARGPYGQPSNADAEQSAHEPMP